MRSNNLSKAIFMLALVLVLGRTGLAQAAETVVLQLRWDHQFQFAGYYAALWQGYYADADIDVEIRSAFAPDGKFYAPTREVADGRAHFGTGGADILKAREGGAPLVVLASIFQRSPVAFYAKAEVGLESPADLTRLRVATRGEQGIAGVELRAMLRAERIDPAAVPQLRIREKLGIHDLAKGYADVVAGFTISAGWVAKELGLKLTSIRPATYGIDFYGSALFTHRNVIEADPQMVQRFVSASLRGWEYALTHPGEIAERISTDLPRTVPMKDVKGFNTYQIEPVSRLTNFPLVELGHTNPNRWKKMHEALADAGLVTQAFDADDLIHDPERAERQRAKRLQTAIMYVLVLVLGAALAGWIWSLRRKNLERDRVETAKKASEERYRTIFDFSPVGMSLSGKGFRFLRVNPKLCQMLGYSEKELLELTILDITHEDDLERTIEFARQALKRLLPYAKYEKRFVKKTGEVIHASVTGGTILDDHGEPSFGIGMIEDITEQKQEDERVRKHTAELAQAMRLGMMGEMATALSHQLNQPLAAIYNFSRGGMRRLANGGSSHDDLRAVLSQISDQSERASRIVRNIGDFVRRGEPEKKLVDVNDLVKTVARLAEAELVAGQIKFRCELADDLPPLMADAIEMEQVVLNLVRNGIEALQEVPAFRRSLEIHTMRRDGAIEIEVGDNGPGLPAESDRLFEPFFSTKPNGLGMGLAIGRTIVEAHGGRLSAESNGERGALIRLRLPTDADQVTHG